MTFQLLSLLTVHTDSTPQTFTLQLTLQLLSSLNFELTRQFLSVHKQVI